MLLTSFILLFVLSIISFSKLHLVFSVVFFFTFTFTIVVDKENIVQTVTTTLNKTKKEFHELQEECQELQELHLQQQNDNKDDKEDAISIPDLIHTNTSLNEEIIQLNRLSEDQLSMVSKKKERLFLILILSSCSSFLSVQHLQPSILFIDVC